VLGRKKSSIPRFFDAAIREPLKLASAKDKAADLDGQRLGGTPTCVSVPSRFRDKIRVDVMRRSYGVERSGSY